MFTYLLKSALSWSMSSLNIQKLAYIIIQHPYDTLYRRSSLHRFSIRKFSIFGNGDEKDREEPVCGEGLRGVNLMETVLLLRSLAAYFISWN